MSDLVLVILVKVKIRNIASENRLTTISYIYSIYIYIYRIYIHIYSTHTVYLYIHINIHNQAVKIKKMTIKCNNCIYITDNNSFIKHATY